ncbi:neuronal pentraxin-1 [Tachyglossus aculeatus]|uniref:neuronal pentraxin-1 n=1 Tax=Tachyglossus aculeatus TaxID=9261 RepID=UPI0018F61153|nr:neuronal pentraxin-1 [Tachyglossus aculeatus]
MAGWARRGSEGLGGVRWCLLLLLLPGLLLLLLGGGRAQGPGPTRFVCTSVPLDTDVCAGGPGGSPSSSGGSSSSSSSGGGWSAEGLRALVAQLRGTVSEQQETISGQRAAIRRLSDQLARCQGQGQGQGQGRPPGAPDPSRRPPGDPHNPDADADALARLAQTLQSLKTRLESLEQSSRLNSSGQTARLKDALQSKIEELERQVLARVGGLEEEGRPGPGNRTDQRLNIDSALTSLHQRISDLEKGQKDNRPGDKFQLTFPLRTNYMYAKVKKSLPEMYAFTVCMWLKSNASPGVGTPFSYAVPGQANELVLIEWGNNPMEILINDKVAKLPFVINDGKWHHICITWTTRDGVWEAYQDGTQGGNGENLAPYHPIKPQGVLVLGQEQDTLGGGFDATQAFVGELAHFNVWDRKLTPGEIYNLATCSTKALAGNVIAWAETNIDIYGGATKWTFEACRQIN